MRATCPSITLSFIHHLITFGEDFNSWDTSRCHFLLPSATYTVKILTQKRRRVWNMDNLFHHKPTNDLQNFYHHFSQLTINHYHNNKYFKTNKCVSICHVREFLTALLCCKEHSVVWTVRQNTASDLQTVSAFRYVPSIYTMNVAQKSFVRIKTSPLGPVTKQWHTKPDFLG